MVFQRIVVLGAIGMVLGCGKAPSSGQSPTQLQQLNGNEYVAVEGSALEYDAASVRGTGKIIFRTPLVEPDNNYAVDFQLANEGSLCVVSQTDRELVQGVRFCFRENADNSLKVELIAGSESYDLSEDFKGVAAIDPLSVSLDIHGHGHLIAWIKDLELEYAFSTRLTGTLWGLELTNATVTSAVQGPPKEAH